MELSNIKGKSWFSTKFTYPQTKSHYEKVMVLQGKKKKNYATALTILINFTRSIA